MRFVVAIAVLALTACASYESRVSSLSDRELCTNLGVYTLKGHEEEARITRDEIDRRSVDKGRCERIANETADRLRPDYKQSLCEHMAEYHYEGEYRAFRKTVDRIRSAGLADEECMTIARFHLRHQQREREDQQRIANAIQAASQEMFGRGSYANPINIQVR